MKNYFISTLCLILFACVNTVYAKIDASNIHVEVPVSFAKKISNTTNSINNFREHTYKLILQDKDETQTRIDILESRIKLPSSSPNPEKKPLDATEKPIAYVKLFLLFITSLVFGSSLIFYGVGVVILVLIARIIYRKIKRR